MILYSWYQVVPRHIKSFKDSLVTLVMIRSMVSTKTNTRKWGTQKVGIRKPESPLLPVCRHADERILLRLKRCCSVRKWAQELLPLVSYAWLWERRKKKKEDDEIGLVQRLVSRLLRTLRYVCECFCVILSACLVWAFVASLVVFLLLHQYGKFEISLAIPK